MAERPRGTQTGCLVIFGMIWLLGVAVFDYLTFPGFARQWRASSDFTKVQGTVLESKVVEVRGEDSTNYRPAIRYQYAVGKTLLENDRYRFGLPGNKLREARAIVRSHPVGSPLEVWYDPAEPAQAVIDPHLSGPDYFLPMFLTPFHAIGLGLLLSPLMGSGRGPGGVPVIKEGLGWRVRTSYGNPLASAISSLGCLTFAGVFIIAIATGMNPSVKTMVLAWASVLALSAYAGLHTMQCNHSGKNDLCIDPGWISYTPFGLCSQRQSRPLSEVEVVEVVTQVSHDSDGETTRSYDVELKLKDGTRHCLRKWNKQAQAQEFAHWMRKVMSMDRV